MSELHERAAALDAILDRLGSVLVAYSGGVDSAFLAVRAHQRLGARSLAVTADSPSLADVQRQTALAVAARFGFAHRTIQTFEVDDPRYRQNAGDRCYHCKTELFRHLLPIASAEGFAHVAYGLIADDLGDHRPGHRAAEEAGIVSPLADAGLGKDDIRVLSREIGLPTWDQPSSPCLASRVAYGTAVTADVLRQVETAEAAVRAMGFREFRVRHLGARARVEVAPAELPRLVEPGLADALARAVRAAGYLEVVVDREGYRRGRLNEALSLR
jgi:uncharacterized protein